MGINYDELDPGIRETVRFLRERGFDTTDSGDGRSKIDVEGAMPVPNVAMACPLESLHPEANRLHRILHGMGAKDFQIQATYDPQDGSSVLLLLDFDDDALANALSELLPQP